MGKINLIIADNDLDYLEGITKFLLNNFSQKFRLSSFSNLEELLSFINGNKEKTDVLLISQNLYSDKIMREMSEVFIIFTAGKSANKENGLEYINKYQKADDIANRIIEIFLEHSHDNSFLNVTSTDTKVVSVFSVAGGAGKSLISAASSIWLAEKGLKVLYLNLEYFQSTQCFFPNNQKSGLSEIFYYVKERKNKLLQKIEEIKSVDPKTNVHFFGPPESPIEIEDLGQEDIKYLINQVRETGKYDVVFIDMSANFDNRNIALLDESDDIYLIFTAGDISIMKLKIFIENLQILNSKTDTEISKKIFFIENKNSVTSQFKIDDITTENTKPVFSIPIVSQFDSHVEMDKIIGISGEFDQMIGLINERFVRGGSSIG